MAASMGSSLFAALAFSGAGYLFHLIDKGGYAEEVHRHNIAMEELAKAREKWYEAEVMRKNKLAQRRQELMEAHQDMAIVNKSLDALARVSMQYKQKKFSRKPKLSDFYRPSEKMKSYQNMAVGMFGAAGGLAIGYLV